MPPLIGTSPGGMGPVVAPQDRRISMHDAALDVLQSTYPRALQDSAGYVANPAPPQIYLGKGKERAHSIAQGPGGHNRGPSMQGGFEVRNGVGYYCAFCGRFCPNPNLHRTMWDGGGCVDFSGNSSVPAQPAGGAGMVAPPQEVLPHGPMGGQGIAMPPAPMAGPGMFAGQGVTMPPAPMAGPGMAGPGMVGQGATMPPAPMAGPGMASQGVTMPPEPMAGPGPGQIQNDAWIRAMLGNEERRLSENAGLFF